MYIHLGEEALAVRAHSFLERAAWYRARIEIAVRAFGFAEGYMQVQSLEAHGYTRSGDDGPASATPPAAGTADLQAPGAAGADAPKTLGRRACKRRRGGSCTETTSAPQAASAVAASKATTSASTSSSNAMNSS